MTHVAKLAAVSGNVTCIWSTLLLIHCSTGVSLREARSARHCVSSHCSFTLLCLHVAGTILLLRVYSLGGRRKWQASLDSQNHTRDLVQSECAHGLRLSSSCETYALKRAHVRRGKKNHASSDGQDRHDRFRSCESIEMHRYLMMTVKRGKIASQASVTLQDPDRRPVRLFPEPCSHVWILRGADGVDGHTQSVIAPCLTTGRSGPHKRPEEAQSHLPHPAADSLTRGPCRRSRSLGCLPTFACKWAVYPRCM